MSNSLVLKENSFPGRSLEAYMSGLRQIPMLSVEEERDLALKFREEGDLDAARQLVLSHLRFVAHIARGYQGYGLPLGDLIQEGAIGLMKAVKRFDPAVGVRLISFAVHWIKSEIHEFVLKNWRIVKVATTKAQRKLFFNLRKASKRLGWFSDGEVDAVAKDLNVSAAEVRNMEMRLNARDESFDLPAPESDDQPRFSPSDYLSDESLDPACLLESANAVEDRRDALQTALQSLDERSRDIVLRRWIADKKTTLQVLSDDYGVSIERIRQLEKAAMTKLRSFLGEAS